MCQFKKTTRSGLSLLAALVLSLAGCQQLQVPAIDPTGEHIFSTSDNLRVATPSDSRYLGGCFYPKPAWEQPISPDPCPEPPPLPPPGANVPMGTAPAAPPRPPQKGVPGKIMLNPTRMIAPVGSEVVLVGGMCGEEGYLITQQPIEFMLSQDSVGQIVEVNDEQGLWCRSKKLSANYAIARTSTRSQVVTRGTPSVTDDVVQQKGQCWISVTSASEGTSYVTAVASKGATWPQRRQSAKIYWVDAQWAFPNPVAVSAGQAHVLSTSVKRTATGAPVVGFIVRYEIVDGTPAVMGPSGATAIEVRTDDDGLANVSLQPTSNLAGVTQVRIQVIRPADPNSDAPRTTLGEGFTSITWSAPGLALRASGPQTGTIDSTLVYRLEVHNPGDIPTRDVLVTDVLPPSLKFVSSTPSARVYGNRAEWSFPEIPARGVQVIEVNLRADAGGAVRYTFQARSGGGLQADASVDTQITRPAITLNVVGPQTAAVGDRAQFRIEVTNASDQVLDNVAISDRFDDGLQHADGLTSPIQKMLGRLDPGQMKTFAVTFIVQREGRICHALEVSAPGGQYAQTQVCLTATQPAVTPQPQLQVSKTANPNSQVGQTVQFSTRITNTGNIPLTNVRIIDSYDAELEPRESTQGWDPAALASGQLMWIVQQLMPGETVQRDVLCLCRQAAEAATSRVTVTAAENISEGAQASVRILAAPEPPPGAGSSVETPAAPGQLSVAIAEFGDPIKVGEGTAYVITVKNDRSVPDQDVVLKVELPLGLRFQSVSGPGQGRTVSPDGRTVQIRPIREMRAGETLQPPFRVEATGAAAGEQTLKVTVTSRLSPQGVSVQEITTVYAQ